MWRLSTKLDIVNSSSTDKNPTHKWQYSKTNIFSYIYVHICISQELSEYNHQFSTAVTNFGKHTELTLAQSARKSQQK